MNIHNSISTGIIFLLTGTVLGALGAHTLKSHLPPELLQSFETGVRYQVYGGLGLLALSALRMQNPQLNWRMGINLIAIGTVLFSVSIYLLSCRSLLGVGSLRWLGPVTPLGGLLIIAGWALLLYKHTIRSSARDAKS